MITGVISLVPVEGVTVLVIVAFVLTLFHQASAVELVVRSETLLRSSSSWDGEPCKSYQSVQANLPILKSIVPLYTKLEWHSHSAPTLPVSSPENSPLREKKMERSSISLLERRFPRDG